MDVGDVRSSAATPRTRSSSLVGSGPTDNPVLHLKVHGVNLPMAIIEVKTAVAFTTASAANMYNNLASTRLRSTATGTVHQAFAQESRTKQPKTCRVIDQVSCRSFVR